MPYYIMLRDDQSDILMEICDTKPTQERIQFVANDVNEHVYVIDGERCGLSAEPETVAPNADAMTMADAAIKEWLATQDIPERGANTALDMLQVVIAKAIEGAVAVAAAPNADDHADAIENATGPDAPNAWTWASILDDAERASAKS